MALIMTKKHASGAELHALFKEVVHLQMILSEAEDEIHEQAGMRTSQVKLANTLLELGQATVPDMAHTMKVSRQFVQTAVNELEKQGVLVFMENPRHKRSKLLKVTDHGRKILKEVARNEAGIIQQLLPNVNAASVMDASKLLEGIRGQLSNIISAKIEPQ